MEDTKRKIVFFGNNYVGREVLSSLISSGNTPAITVMHRRERSYYFDEIHELAASSGTALLFYDQVRTAEGLNQIREAGPDIGISAYYGYILEPELLDLFPMGVVNMHGAHLPWSKGRNPNVWTIVDRVPAGVTLHLMDSQVDTGPILAQRQIELTPDMTAKDLYACMEQTMLKLFADTIPDILAGRITPKPQTQEQGTFHRGSELDRLKKLDLDEVMPVGRILDILRACTFPPFPGARFTVDGNEYDVNIQITKVAEGVEAGG